MTISNQINQIKTEGPVPLFFSINLLTELYKIYNIYLVELCKRGKNMKLERVNEHQIRCTLTRADLAARQIKISELAYGSEKAKLLFRDMMQKASYELGFEADNIPLMIEAVPLSSESIILIITKVDDPEELDTRFANFAPSVHDSDSDNSIDNLISSISADAENVLDLFKKFRQSLSSEQNDENPEAVLEASSGFDLTKSYSFDSLDSVIKVSKLLKNFYFGKSSLYKNVKTDKLLLVVSKSNHTPEDFNRVCNIVSEYGICEKYTEATAAYLEEHGECILKDNALQTLVEI